MGSDKKQFYEALYKWDLLHEKERFSATSDIGETAIIYSDFSLGETHSDRIKELEIFENEAYRIRSEVLAQNGIARVIRGISPMNIYEHVIEPTEVSDIVIIGHGTFSSVFCNNNQTIDWNDIANETTHLKLGYIEQRFCGHFARNLSVPFGAFLVSSPQNVFAAPGKYFSPESNSAHEEFIKSVTPLDRLSLNDIKMNFARIKKTGNQAQSS